MNWKVIADTTELRVGTNFDYNVYLQEQPTIKVLSKNNRAVLVGLGSDIVSYTPDENKMVFINLTDYMSVFGDGSIGVGTPVSSRIDVNYRVVGMVSPENMIIPRINDIQDFVPIIQPSKMYALPFGLYGRVSVWNNGQFDDVYYGAFQSKTLPLSPLASNLEIKEGLFVSCGDIKYSTHISPLSCGRTYAAVQWATRWGGVNVMTFEVVDVKQTQENIVELSSRFNGFNVRKGYVQSFVLRLSGLNKYDYWYYSDIITSNDVRVAVNEIDANFGDATRVDVITKSVTIPNSNGLYSLELEIKYKRYDRV
ncbi:MAG: hypothetical protein UHX00_13515 [Caryophanon sp.]|nr:hypothetical protein [Caryophanon sp.]